MTTITDIAGGVATVDEAVLKALPFISFAIGFIPGGAVAVPFMPLAGEVLQALDNAARQIQAGNSGAAIEDVLAELKSHLTPGMPNSPILSLVGPSQDPSAQGGEAAA